MREKRHTPATLTCPLCGSKLKNKELRLYKNIVYCDMGAISLGHIELRFVQELRRSFNGLTTTQLAELVGTTAVNVNSRVKQLNTKLEDIGWELKNVVGGGRIGALYMLRKISQ